MTSSKSEPKADDLCGVCNVTRENHGDTRHEFNMDGDLIPKPPAEPARQKPPQMANQAAGMSSDAQKLDRDPVARLQLRMVERLVSKGLLNGDDLMYIFGNADH